MGEIGIDEDKFLYHYKYWQLLAIKRGYRKRTHDYQILMRWQTWAILKGIAGLEAESPQDLLTLPCDPREEKDTPPSEDELNALIAECEEYNKHIDDNHR